MINVKSLSSTLFLSFIFLLAFSKPKAMILKNPTSEFKVLSWNVYMLPGIANLSKQITKSDKKGRAREIAEYLNSSDYDVVVFQEAFFNPSRRLLSKLIEEEYPYQIGPANPSKMSLKTSSGIFVVSKKPLKVLETIQYETCNGADCFAKKGAVLLEGIHESKPYQILGTHINAGGPSWIKEEQFKMMRKLLDDFLKLDVPQIVCGDMNTHKEDPDKYAFLIKTLDVEDAPTNSKQVFTTAKNRSVIDYIFLRNNGTNFHLTNKEVLWIKAKMPVIDKLHGNLSDHLAVKAHFSW